MSGIRKVLTESDNDPKKLKELLLKECYNNFYSITKIAKAINLAQEIHKNQKRKSGFDFIIHPLNVAIEISQINLGEEAVIAALLHDTVEDGEIETLDIVKRFGESVGELVEGVTKIDQIAHNSTKRYTELMSLRKLLLASSKDIRILMIKLADRLDNMRTIDALPETKRIEYSDETLKVYVPIAEYLGIGKWKRELEDIALFYQNNNVYEYIKNKVFDNEDFFQNTLNSLIKEIQVILDREHIPYGKVYGRIKSVSSVYNKFLKYQSEGKAGNLDEFDFTKIKDYIAVSVILKTDVLDCYKVLGIIHSKFRHYVADFKDYIAKPRINGYRSIHTVVTFNNRPVEIHIKTANMHYINEFGPASHIAYKLSKKRDANSSNDFGWVKKLTNWTSEITGKDKFKINLFTDKVFAITPKGRVIELEDGSTPIDFAYAIHSDIGNKYIGAKINEKISKPDSKINNGDIVEILTSKIPKNPNPDWLKFVKQNSTKKKISRFIRQSQEELIVESSKESLRKYIFDSIHIDWLSLESTIINELIKHFGCIDVNEFYTRIAHGNIHKLEVTKYLVSKLNIASENTKRKKRSSTSQQSQILVEGMDGFEYITAKCCNPSIYDNVVGIVTIRDGLKIHKKNCKMLERYDKSRILSAKWV